MDIRRHTWITLLVGALGSLFGACVGDISANERSQRDAPSVDADGNPLPPGAAGAGEDHDAHFVGLFSDRIDVLAQLDEQRRAQGI